MENPRQALRPAITVTICIHKRLTFLPGVLAAIAAQSLARDAFHVVVIDNTPDAEVGGQLAQLLAAEGQSVACIRAQPAGLSRARNVALAACTTPFIAFLDDDAFPEEGWLAAILGGFAQRDVHVVVGPIEPLWLADRPDWLPKKYEGSLTILDYGPMDAFLPPGRFGYGANMAFRCDTLRDAGGFDESLGRKGVTTLLGGEETAVQRRMTELGYKVFYAAAARVLHCIHPERLTQDWLRARTGWTAVTWALQEAPIDLDATTQRLVLSARRLGIAGSLAKLFSQTDAAGLCCQLDVVLSLLTLLLFGAAAPDECGRALLTALAAEGTSEPEAAPATR